MAAGTRKAFTFEEARALLPAVRERTRRAILAISALPVRADEANGEGDEVRLQEATRQILAAWMADIQALGAEVKGPWLVDFDSGGGYYCWKWPEESLEFFHGYTEGFAGRVRLQ